MVSVYGVPGRPVTLPASSRRAEYALGEVKAVPLAARRLDEISPPNEQIDGRLGGWERDVEILGERRRRYVRLAEQQFRGSHGAHGRSLPEQLATNGRLQFDETDGPLLSVVGLFGHAT